MTTTDSKIPIAGLKPGINPADIVPLRKPPSHRLVLGFGLLVVALLSVFSVFAFVFAVPHLNAVAHLSALGSSVDWHIDRTTWKTWGVSKVYARSRYLISKAYLTDLDVDTFLKLINLKELTLIGCEKITDKGIEQIAKLPHLELLDLTSQNWGDGMMHGPRITDAGLEPLTHMKTLKHLYLCGSNISDVGLKTIGTMTELETLDLSETKITDEGLQNLESLVNLKTLLIDMTEISDKAVQAFGAKLPKLEFVQVTGPNSQSTTYKR